MPIKIRHAKKIYEGVTVADLARYWGISPQAAEKKAAKSEAPKPLATIQTLDDAGRVVKEQKVWTELWDL